MKKLFKKLGKGLIGSIFVLALLEPVFARAALSPVLDRANLFKVANVTNSSPRYALSATAQPNETLKLMVHVHNSVPDTTLEDVRVKVSLPSGEITNASPTAYVSASNAGGINSRVALNFTEPVTLSYIPGSTRLINHNYTESALPDGVATSGVGINIGDVPGCWEYERWVTFLVRVTANAQSEQSLVVTKFHDANGNRSQDAGEVNLAGWQFRVSGPNGYSRLITTDANGQARLTGLAVGRYVVSEVTRAGWINTTGLSLTEDITAGETQRFIFGNRRVTPDTPLNGGGEITRLSTSGPGDVAGVIAASMGLSGGTLAWIRSKRRLLDALKK